MSRKKNSQRRGEKTREYGSLKGGGMRKHATSGYVHNHANSIARVRETNRTLESEAQRRERIRQKWFEESERLGNNSSR
jgi:hypothetical protein